MGEQLADVLRYHRRRAGLTQEELAERSGVSVRTIRGIESGKRPNPQLASVRQLVTALDLQPNEQNELLSAATGASEQSASPVPRQLPSDVVGFVGRATELGRLDSMLHTAGREQSAVVISAVSGTAGVGKTALAVHWAHRVADHFTDGQLYVNLRGFDASGAMVEPAEAVRGFLDALGVPPQRIPADVDAQVGLYRSLVAGRRMLVMLDNARDADQVRPLLPGTAGCLVVVTSRNQLTSLMATHNAHPLSLDLLSATEAEQLLAGRLGRTRTAAEADAVAAIIDHCARLPLALAVVAARAATRPTFPLSALVAELREADGNLDGLAGTEPSTDVRSVFSWSYQALSPGAARAFRLLGLHWGAEFGLAGVASLTGLPTATARQLLTELTGAHLITENLTGRYTFHDLLRDYAAQQTSTIDSADERTAAVLRLRDHYLHTAYLAALLFYPQRRPIELPASQPGTTRTELADLGQALTWFTQEHATVVAAARQALAQGHLAHAWRLAWALSDFLDRSGHWSEQAEVQRTALTAADQLGDLQAQAHARRGLARACSRLGAYQDTYTHLSAALEVLEELADTAGQAHIHLNFTETLLLEGKPAEALAHAMTALELSSAIDDRVGRSVALNGIGWCHALLGDYEQTLAFCGQALEVHVELGARSYEANALDSLGYAHQHLGHHAEAVDCYQRAATINRELGDQINLAEALTHLGEAQLAAGEVDAAHHAWSGALTALDTIDSPDAEQLRARLLTLPVSSLRGRGRRS
ncbi:ATP-binding protein [Allokutzneria oryzae]|uniref:Tetratricopeptide repeat protein n=1 Tax=Allokutzneria oryzae TaxID=1378989 RepID=A0ABV6A8X5_9PSEU